MDYIFNWTTAIVFTAGVLLILTLGGCNARLDVSTETLIDNPIKVEDTTDE